MKFAIQVAFLCVVAVTAFPANEVKDTLPGQAKELKPADDLETAATFNLGSLDLGGLASLASLGIPADYLGTFGAGKDKSSSSEEHVHKHKHVHRHYYDDYY